MGDSAHARTQTRRQVRDFLTGRRARLTPGDVGLPAVRANRRVRGLRREEVAALAGISVDYYIRLERGDARGVSDGVLRNVGRALRLDETEHAHLLDLVRAGDGARPCRPVAGAAVLRPSVRRILDSMTTTPALVLDGRLAVVGANALGRALYQPMYGACGNASVARFVFTDPAARSFWPDWDVIADDTANALRAASGSNPCDRGLGELTAELAARSTEFASRWDRHDLHVARTGTRRIAHPLVGRLTLPFESTPLAADPGQTLLMYSAAPGSAEQDALHIMASWTTADRGGR
ncbi:MULTISPECIES: helix-turn-helix domain-containing protein [Streptomyces]|uniref:Helix-turn-helix transcriptional regulator n=1 Tax=Streptomyces doudnae TaxID=3075536 RepID=A0ABD5EGL4_9ACTN|nr:MULTISPECIES: helix-turn-helix transcriptional regulator [unclassified Streptomyces]MDT0433781.1 helix-turn-helix transcriptional regulator [Streptomyces sp. DSM 41981]MYQ68923.1 helix-turn-helix domain-containing protein [Streptomyces sp. SID4950]SCE50104.1 Helix-turn-helix domain-containing protein [Streptomyces sp. SolWspMP-5a-2]